MKKRTWIAFIAGVCLFFFSMGGFAATLELKNGNVIEGEVGSRDETYVKMAVQGVELTYWADDIQALTLNDGTRIVFGAAASSTPPADAVPAAAGVPPIAASPENPAPSPAPASSPASTPVEETALPNASASEAAPSAPPVSPAPEVVFKREGASGSMSFKPEFRAANQQGAAASIAAAIFAIIFFLAFYAFFAICLKTIAEKTGTANGWWAWIPIVSLILMCDIAGKPRWWAALFLISIVPFVGVIAAFILSCLIQMEIAVRRGKPNWWGVLMSLPLVNVVAYGYVAFSK